MPRRLAEAARLGFRTAFTPRGVLGSGPIPEGMQVMEVADVREAVMAALDVPHNGTARR
jgi:DNA repair protein RadA/Sms